MGGISNVEFHPSLTAKDEIHIGHPHFKILRWNV
jgi:hypothetical protein